MKFYVLSFASSGLRSNCYRIIRLLKACYIYLITSLSQKLDSPKQTAEFQAKQRQIVWKIDKLPGKTETVAQFRVGLSAS